jgi:small ligand-binding sensory domain FIST
MARAASIGCRVLALATHAAAQHQADGIADALLCRYVVRGGAMSGDPHHDAGLVTASPPGSATPVAGLCCNGDYRAVAGRSYSHGITATRAIFGAR